MNNLVKDTISILASGSVMLTPEATQKIFAKLIAFSEAKDLDPQANYYKRWEQQPVFEQRFQKFADANIHLTTDYANESIEHSSIAFYLIDDMITFDSRWWFSTREFVEDFKAAEANPRIAGHFILINSGGGQAYYLEVADAALKNATKPIFKQIEECCASAAYYIGSNGYLAATTNFDSIGSIGTMVSGLDIIPYFEKLGAKYYEIYSDYSKQKNYQSRELKVGNERPIIDEILNPYCESFINAVKGSRPSLTKVNESEGIFEGKIFFASQALKLGLVDAIQPIDITLLQCYEATQKRKQIYSFI